MESNVIEKPILALLAFALLVSGCVSTPAKIIDPSALVLSPEETGMAEKYYAYELNKSNLKYQASTIAEIAEENNYGLMGGYIVSLGRPSENATKIRDESIVQTIYRFSNRVEAAKAFEAFEKRLKLGAPESSTYAPKVGEKAFMKKETFQTYVLGLFDATYYIAFVKSNVISDMWYTIYYWESEGEPPGSYEKAIGFAELAAKKIE